MSTDTPDLLPNATRDLARFASGLRFEDIPATVASHARLCLLDGLGVALFGAGLPWTRKVLDMALADGAKPVASFWGGKHKGSAALAALVNGTAGHAFEMDDIHKESIVHPNSLACPVALALAEDLGSQGRKPGGKDVLTAIVAGYEIGTRVGNAATMDLFLRGFHPQGTSGVFVAVVAAGRLLGLDAQQMHNAMGIAGSMGAGLMAAQEGAMVKRLHAGHAAQSGVQAARLAQRGFTGIGNVLEAGYGGFLSAFSGKPDAKRLTEGLGTQWETAEVGFKMYPSVTSIHSALDALHTVMTVHALKAGDVAQISVGVGHMTYVHTAWLYKSAGVTAAQMNMYYGLAMVALHGDASARHYAEDRLDDAAMLDFIAKIAVHEDAGLEAMGAAFRHACRLQVKTTDGRVIDHENLQRRGSPEVPVGEMDIRRKFEDNVTGLLKPAESQKLQELALNVDALADVEELVGCLRV